MSDNYKKYFVVCLFLFVSGCKKQENLMNGNNGGGYLNPHLTNLTVHSFDGTNIYGNGYMQSKVDVSFNLIPSAYVKSVRFLDAITKKPIDPSSGWAISERKNQFEHVIPSNPGSTTPLPFPSQSLLETRYISGSSFTIGKQLNLCVEIDTLSNNQLQTHQSCSAANLVSLTINSLPPAFLPSSNFHIQHYSKIHSDAKNEVDLYKVKTTGIISPDINRLTQINVPKLRQDGYILPSPDNTANQNNSFYANIVNALAYDYQLTDNNSSFISLYLWDNQIPKNLNLLTSISDKTSVPFSFPINPDVNTPGVIGNIATLARVMLNQHEYLIADKRCTYDHVENNDCRGEIGPHTLVTVTANERNAAVKTEINEASAYFQDNFGTVHPVFIRIDTSFTNTANQPIISHR